MRINYNIPALTMSFIQDQAIGRQSTSLQRITSGYKISSGKDNPGAIVQSENIRIRLLGMQSAAQNAQDGVSMLQNAEGGMNEVTNMIQRIRQLVVQSGDGSIADNDKKIIQNEIDEALDGINDIAGNTEFNTFKLLGSDKSIDIQIGAGAGESVSVQQINITDSSSDDGIKALYNLKTGGSNSILNGNIDESLNAVDNAMNSITSMRSHYGALENRFQSTYYNIQDLSEQMTDAESSIVDTDISEEIVNYSKEDIIVQASNAMIAQANKLPQDILQILSTFNK